MPVIVSETEVDADELARWRAPRTDVVVEEDLGDGRYRQATGPFRAYERRLEVTPLGTGRHRVTQTVDHGLAFGPWTLLFRIPMRRVLSRPGGSAPWWAPPQVLDRQGAASLASLASLSVVAGYLGTLIGQTLTYAADEFGAGERAQGDTLAVVRVGVLLALGVAAWADRHGRRRALLWCSAAGCVTASLGALSPGLVALGGSQLVARGMSTALALLIVVVVAEEMPAGSRAYGVSLLTMSGGLGAGMVLWFLPVVEVDERAWRLLYVFPLVFLPLIRSTARMLPESRRFARRHAAARFAGHGRRLALLATSALLLAVLSAPASQLQNEFLRDEFHLSALGITVFTIVTVTPAGIGIVIGGRLADIHGKRLVGGIGVAAGAVFTALQYLASTPAVLWAAAFVGSVLGGLAVPTITVYGPELFPTALRSRANVVITTLGVSGSVIGLVVAGRLADRWSLGPAIAVLAAAPLVVALLLVPLFPETARRELEDLNPEDALAVPVPR